MPKEILIMARCCANCERWGRWNKPTEDQTAKGICAYRLSLDPKTAETEATFSCLQYVPRDQPQTNLITLRGLQ